MKDCDTMRHNATQCDKEVGIQTGNTRVFRPALNRAGKKVPGVYVRDGYYYVRVTDADGKRRWVKSIEQTIEASQRFLAQYKRERDQNRMLRFTEALEGSRARRTSLSVAQLVEAYKKAAAEHYELHGKPGQRFVNDVVSNVTNAVSSMGMNPESLSIIVLPDVIRQWALKHLEQQDLSRHTIKSILGSCTCLFGSWAREYYARNGIKIPEGIKFIKITVPSVQYKLPSQEARDKVIAFINEQWKEHTSISFVMVLAYYAGMSRADIVRAEWSWVRNGHVYYERHKTGRRADPPLPEFVADWFASEDAAALQNERQYIIPGETERQRLYICDKAADVLREVGWGDRLVLHELRKLACSQWATRCGLQWAARWIGDNEATAASYYRDLLPEQAPKAW